LGKEFFRWEIATAVAAAVLQINAFDEPNVRETKDNTDRLLKSYASGRRTAASARPLLRESGVSLFGGAQRGTAAAAKKAGKGKPETIGKQLAAHFRLAQPGDYIAILAYVPPQRATRELLQHLRMCLRDALGVATTVGFGPRYLHSTGQFHKGGPPKGIFLEITKRDAQKLAIPSLPYGFSVLKQAQAQGDLEALQARGRPVLRLHLEEGVEAGLRRAIRGLESEFAGARPTRRSKRKA
jgi:hypothetical protein